MSMIEVKTADLIGPALDWAVAEAEGIRRFVMGNDWPGNSVVADAADRDRVVICNMIGQLVVSRGGWSNGWNPSTDWAQGGPLIEKYGVLLSPPRSMMHVNGGPNAGWRETGTWDSTIFGTERKHRRKAFEHQDQPLVAAMRAIVQFELGDVVSVPAELVQQQGEGGGK